MGLEVALNSLMPRDWEIRSHVELIPRCLAFAVEVAACLGSSELMILASKSVRSKILTRNGVSKVIEAHGNHLVVLDESM